MPFQTHLHIQVIRNNVRMEKINKKMHTIGLVQGKKNKKNNPDYCVKMKHQQRLTMNIEVKAL